MYHRFIFTRKIWQYEMPKYDNNEQCLKSGVNDVKLYKLRLWNGLATIAQDPSVLSLDSIVIVPALQPKDQNPSNQDTKALLASQQADFGTCCLKM